MSLKKTLFSVTPICNYSNDLDTGDETPYLVEVVVPLAQSFKVATFVVTPSTLNLWYPKWNWEFMDAKINNILKNPENVPFENRVYYPYLDFKVKNKAGIERIMTEAKRKMTGFFVCGKVINFFPLCTDNSGTEDLVSMQFEDGKTLTSNMKYILPPSGFASYNNQDFYMAREQKDISRHILEMLRKKLLEEKQGQKPQKRKVP